jgi:hypothetical protein
MILNAVPGEMFRFAQHDNAAHRESLSNEFGAYQRKRAEAH